MNGLTQKQSKILQFIQDFIEKNHYSPSYREIMQQFSYSSPGTVYKHIRTLKRKGMIELNEKSSRSLMPTAPLNFHQQKAEVEVNFMGNISAGNPIEMFKHPQTFSVPAQLVKVPENTYVLRVNGDSLIEEMMLDGDFLIIEACQEAQTGDTILGLVNFHDTIIKKYYCEGLYIRLEGNNPHHRPLMLRQEDLAIQGVLIGLIRSY